MTLLEEYQQMKEEASTADPDDNDLLPLLRVARKGQPILQVQLLGTNFNLVRLIETLVRLMGADCVELANDAYVTTSEGVANDTPLAEAFAKGHPAVSEGLMVVKVTATGRCRVDEVKYFDEGGKILWGEGKTLDSDEGDLGGRIVEMLTTGMNYGTTPIDNDPRKITMQDMADHGIPPRERELLLDAIAVNAFPVPAILTYLQRLEPEEYELFHKMLKVGQEVLDLQAPTEEHQQ